MLPWNKGDLLYISIWIHSFFFFIYWSNSQDSQRVSLGPGVTIQSQSENFWAITMLYQRLKSSKENSSSLVQFLSKRWLSSQLVFLHVAFAAYFLPAAKRHESWHTSDLHFWPQPCSRSRPQLHMALLVKNVEGFNASESMCHTSVTNQTLSSLSKKQLNGSVRFLSDHSLSALSTWPLIPEDMRLF